MAVTIIIVPGYTNSGPGHWQSIIERKYQNIIRAEQEDWNNPVSEKWVEGLQRTIKSVSGNIVLVGHSCGVITIIQWAQKYQNMNVIGALLVAPADVDSEHAPKEIKVQSPIPTTKLLFKSIMVHSNNDEYLSKARALIFGEHWGSELIEIKNAGHINTASGFGEWKFGEKLIEKLSGIPLEIKFDKHLN